MRPSNASNARSPRAACAEASFSARSRISAGFGDESASRAIQGVVPADAHRGAASRKKALRASGRIPHRLRRHRELDIA